MYHSPMYLNTITVISRAWGDEGTHTDEYGNEIPSPPGQNKPDVEVPAWWEPATSTEDTNARDQRVWGYWVTCPLTVRTPRGTQATREVITAAEAVLIDGVPYEVVGEVGHQPGGFVIDGYVMFKVERVTG